MAIIMHHSTHPADDGAARPVTSQARPISRAAIPIMGPADRAYCPHEPPPLTRRTRNHHSSPSRSILACRIGTRRLPVFRYPISDRPQRGQPGGSDRGDGAGHRRAWQAGLGFPAGLVRRASRERGPLTWHAPTVWTAPATLEALSCRHD
jgi:hypothetical protein